MWALGEVWNHQRVQGIRDPKAYIQSLYGYLRPPRVLVEGRTFRLSASCLKCCRAAYWGLLHGVETDDLGVQDFTRPVLAALEGFMCPFALKSEKS